MQKNVFSSNSFSLLRFCKMEKKQNMPTAICISDLVMLIPWFYSENLGTVKKRFTKSFEKQGRESVDDWKIQTFG